MLLPILTRLKLFNMTNENSRNTFYPAPLTMFIYGRTVHAYSFFFFAGRGARKQYVCGISDSLTVPKVPKMPFAKKKKKKKKKKTTILRLFLIEHACICVQSHGPAHLPKYLPE